MTQKQSIEARIRAYVLKTFPLARKHGVKDSDKWLETGMLDSLGILDLVHFLEEEFSIRVSDEELLPDNFHSLIAVAGFVQSKSNGTGAGSAPKEHRTPVSE